MLTNRRAGCARAGRLHKSGFAGCAIGMLVVLLALLPGAALAAEQSSQPFVGITLERMVDVKPRPEVIHVAVINPAAPGIRFLVTPGNGDSNGVLPGDPNWDTTRETTLAFITQQHAQLGINGAYFTFLKGTLNTDDVSLVVSNGHLVSRLEPHSHWVLNITADNRVQIRKVNRGDADNPGNDLYNTIAGYGLLVHDGQVVAPTGLTFDDSHLARTAVAVTASGRLLLVTVDGGQPGFAQGMSLRELARFLAARGAVEALNLDGGGSTSMAIADPTPRVANYPSDRTPSGAVGQPRQVGVNLAVFAHANPHYKRLPPIRKPNPLRLLKSP